MRGFATSGRQLTAWAALTTLVSVLSAVAGCNPVGSDGLVVATCWSFADRRSLESEFQNWLRSSNSVTGGGASEIRWLILEPGDDLLRIPSRGNQPDVLLGGHTSAFVSLAQSKFLSPIMCAKSALWSGLSRLNALIPVKHPLDPIRLQSGPPDFVIADPRVDRISLEWAIGQLRHGHFREGYALLVRVAANPRRIGRHARWTRPVMGHEDANPLLEFKLASEATEGVAIFRSAEHPDRAQTFLRFLAETRRLDAKPDSDQRTKPTDSMVEALVADLLGATLVDAQDELWAAWGALERANYPPTALKWMTEPPPWPPASVGKILNQPAENAMALMETLAREIAPEPPVRAWLVRSWLSPLRLIDDTLLTDLAGAVEGRLYHEPRFRAWLRAEWTAWARQRYRRVLKIATTQPVAERGLSGE